MPDPEQTKANPPPVAAASANAAAPATSLVDQYDAEGDSEPAAPASVDSRSPSPEPESRGPDRDPATGRFLPSTPETRKPSQYLVGMAQDLGIDPAEIAGMTPDTLEVAVYHLSKQHRANQQWARDREGSREQTRDQATDRNIAGGQAAAGQTEGESRTPSPPTSDDAFDLGIDEQAYDPALIGAIKKMGAHAKEIKQLKEQIGHLHRLEMVRANETFAQKMDRLFSDDESTFGKGEGRALKEDGPELARRRAVLGVMQGIKTGTIEDKYAKAYEMLYGTRQAHTDDSLAARQDEWRRGNVARPTQRGNASEPPGVEKAKRTAAQKMAEMNGAVESGEASADDFLE
jgi:hypothetical protein